MNATLDLIPVSTERLSIEEYMRQRDQLRTVVKSVRIIPPSLDSNSLDEDCFGEIEVEYRTPLYHCAR